MAWQDPVTGDSMSFGDRASWLAQGLIRRWPVLVFHVALSVFWWTHPDFFGDDNTLTKWMVLYSLLAVVNEQIVGIGMFSQAKRDAVVLREVRELAKDIRTLVAREEQEIVELIEEVSELGE